MRDERRGRHSLTYGNDAYHYLFEPPRIYPGLRFLRKWSHEHEACGEAFTRMSDGGSGYFWFACGRVALLVGATHCAEVGSSLAVDNGVRLGGVAIDNERSNRTVRR